MLSVGSFFYCVGRCLTSFGTTYQSRLQMSSNSRLGS